MIFFTLTAKRTVAALALFPLTSLAAGAAPAGVSPCTWHVRLNYHYRDAGPLGEHDTQVLLALEAPLRCAGSGTETILIPGGAVLAQGRAHVHRNVPHAGGPPTARDISDKQAIWPAAADARGPAPGIEPPAPSFVGTGYGTKVIVAGALTGTQRDAVSDAIAAPAPAPAPGARELTTALEPEADPDRLQLELFFDPLPGTPSDAAGALAHVPERTREALAAPGGEAALAIKGHLFGAQTQTTDAGDFSICYQRKLVLAPATVDVDFCGWLTRGTQYWEPARLPATEPAAVP
jgi:hypothetical protein